MERGGILIVNLEDPSQIPDEWRSYFDTLPVVEGKATPDISHATVRNHFLLLARNQARATPMSVRGSLMMVVSTLAMATELNRVG